MSKSQIDRITNRFHAIEPMITASEAAELRVHLDAAATAHAKGEHGAENDHAERFDLLWEGMAENLQAA